MNWTELPSIQSKRAGCLCCGLGGHSLFPADALIAVGFGIARLLKNGEAVYDEPNNPADESEYMTGAQAEELAATDPDNDWRILLHGPLRDALYQRQSGGWVLVEEGHGFA